MEADSVALAALVVSIATFLYAWLYNRRQDLRWEALNLPRFAVRDLDLATWREMSLEEHAMLQWGYANPFVVVVPDTFGGVGGSRLRVLVAIVGYRKNSDFLTGIVGITVREVLDNIVARGHDPEDYVLVKYYTLKFSLENVGATAATDLGVKTRIWFGSEEVAARDENNGGSVLPAERLYTVVRWFTEIEKNFPVNLKITIDLTYRHSARAVQRTQYRFHYDVTVGAFRRGS